MENIDNNLIKKYTKLLSKLSSNIVGIDIWTNKLISKIELTLDLETQYTDEIVKVLGHYCKDKQSRLKNSLELIIVGESLGYSLDKIEYDRINTYKQQLERTKLYNKKPQQEGRDNKGVYVGSGNHWGSTVRYPSKKRNKKTWKTFYKMFPLLAKNDNWDGNTSDKMKQLSKKQS